MVFLSPVLEYDIYEVKESLTNMNDLDQYVYWFIISINEFKDNLREH